MVPLLGRRIGADTVSKLEAAASRRLDEAHTLEESGQALGAIYLYGYVAEARLQAALFRMLGYRPQTEILEEQRKRIFKAAIKEKLMSAKPHDLGGLADLVIVTRKRRAAGYNDVLKAEIVRRARGLYGRWRPSLRYRATVPMSDEVRVVRSAAEWFDENYSRLWS
jgi:hypothetical protein